MVRTNLSNLWTSCGCVQSYEEKRKKKKLALLDSIDGRMLSMLLILLMEYGFWIIQLVSTLLDTTVDQVFGKREVPTIG
ncbi:hypothetical protein REPUB_Repub16aG0037100 [Reevesia pubescens]